MIGLIVALMAQQTVVSEQPGGRLDVPPALRASVMPYAECFMGRVNARMPIGDQQEARQALEDAAEGCAELRRRGSASAEAVLRRSGRYPDASARHAAVSAVFDQVARAFEPLFRVLRSAEETPSAEEK